MATVYFNGFEWNSFYENILSWGGGNTSIVSEFAGARGFGALTKPCSGNYSLYIRSYDSFIRWQTVPLNEFYFQMALKIDYSSNNGNILQWNSSTPNVLGNLTFNPTDQKLSVYVGNQVTKIGTSTTQLQYDRWYLVEMHIDLHTSGGTIELKIDGQSQFIFSGATTPNDTEAIMFYLMGNTKDGQLNSSSGFWVDDIVINDTTGSNNNSWPNGAKIVLLFPGGKGDSSQWEKIAGLDNYYNVAQYPTLDPSMYVFTDHTGKLDLYLLQNLPTDAYSVDSVRVDAWALKNSGSDVMLELAMLISGLTFMSPDNELGTSYGLIQWLHQINPGTSIDWTVQVVNNLQGGIKSNVPE